MNSINKKNKISFGTFLKFLKVNPCSFRKNNIKIKNDNTVMNGRYNSKKSLVKVSRLTMISDKTILILDLFNS